MLRWAALLTGFVLDLLFGDPHGYPFPHPVVWMGRCVTRFEQWLRRRFPATPRGELWAGGFLAAGIPLLFFLLAFIPLRLLWNGSPWLAYAAESYLCYRILATRSLREESMAVYKALAKGDLTDARYWLSRIVGRDTQDLDRAAVARAAVETVAENTGDGVIAPLLFMALGGAPLGLAYKAVNTLDSMVGYKNAKYLYMGRVSARLDDAANYLPSRLAGLLMVGAAAFLGFDARGAFRIWRRDRRKHRSPNSAQTEAAASGALGLQLGGGSRYQGVYVDKPFIGDPVREIDAEDIVRANHLLYATAILGLVLSLGIRAILLG